METIDYSDFEIIELRHKQQLGGFGTKAVFAYTAVQQGLIDRTVEGWHNGGLTASQTYYWVATVVELISSEGSDETPRVFYSIPLPCAIRGGARCPDRLASGQVLAKRISRKPDAGYQYNLITMVRERYCDPAIKGMIAGMAVVD
jgi:hypothetical protein